MIVVDSSAVVDALLWDGAARTRLTNELLVAPFLIDAEFMSTLRWHVNGGKLDEKLAQQVREDFVELDLLRYEHLGLMERAWELRDNLSCHDALYVALAEWHEVTLVTTDARLARAPTIQASVEVVPMGGP